jgi:glycosyltransferase involved in cell wall biosynthesis
VTPPDLRSLRVCLIAGTLGQGGAERQLFYIARVLEQSGATVQLLCLTQGEHWEKPIRDLGVPVIWAGENPSRAERMFAICKLARRFRPDIVQSQHFYTNLYATAAARFCGCPEIGAIRNNVTSEVAANGPILGPLSLRAPRILAANSTAAIQTAIGRGIAAKRLFLLPNMVDTDRFQPPRMPRPDAPIRILGIGRLAPQKRFDLFLEVVAAVKRQTQRPLTAVIVGEGPLRADLEKRAAELGLFPGTVEFPGADPNPVAQFQQASLYLLTSAHEGTPNVVLEAMATGLPVVATRVGGVPDLIEHGTGGLLAEPGDIGSLTASVLSLVEQEDRRRELGARARTFVERRHSASRLRTAMEDIYAACVNSR